MDQRMWRYAADTLHCGIDGSGKSDDLFQKRLSPSSTVQKVKILVLNDLEKGKIALALHFRAYLLIIYSSRNVGGSATPQARIAAEACAWS